MNIVIQHNHCWICNSTNEITMHHALPRHLNPKKNVIIPICDKCHQQINDTDIKGIYGFAYKIYKTMIDTGKQTKVLFQRIINQKK